MANYKFHLDKDNHENILTPEFIYNNKPNEIYCHMPNGMCFKYNKVELISKGRRHNWMSFIYEPDELKFDRYYFFIEKYHKCNILACGVYPSLMQFLCSECKTQGWLDRLGNTDNYIESTYSYTDEDSSCNEILVKNILE